MANHHLTVAKATFSASLLRPDVTKIDRSELPQFHSLLETATLKCSASNIQKCKQWLLDNILCSSQRTSSFARYLTAFAKYAQGPEGQNQCSSQRQRLHILYLLNDLFHHAKYHTGSDTMIHDLVQAFQSPLLEIVQQASVSAKARICKRLENILSIWEDAGYLEADILAKARKVMDDPSTSLESGEKSAPPSKSIREAPFIMPTSHGDPSLPFYELPAGNLMLHIVPNKSIPMRPHSIRPLQFPAGPADESLANAVRDFLKDVENIDHEFDLLDDPAINAGISDMGQVLYRNEADDLVGDTYFGWSRAFCEKMAARKKPGASGDDRSRTTSLSEDRSRSRSPRRKRRFSGSDSSRSLSDSRSRSRGKQQLRQHFESDTHRSRSPTDKHQASFTPEFRPQSFFHPPAIPSAMPPITHDHQQLAPTPSLMGGMPFLPPRPPNWQGLWPPPPPPPPGMPGVLPPLPPTSNLGNQHLNHPVNPDNRNQHQP